MKLAIVVILLVAVLGILIAFLSSDSGVLFTQ